MIAAVIGAGPHRTLLVAAGSIVVNAAYAAWNLALGVSGVSAWLVPTAMLATFGSEPRLFHALTVATGTFVYVASVAVGTSLIRAAGRVERVGP